MHMALVWLTPQYQVRMWFGVRLQLAFPSSWIMLYMPKIINAIVLNTMTIIIVRITSLIIGSV